MEDDSTGRSRFRNIKKSVVNDEEHQSNYYPGVKIEYFSQKILEVFIPEVPDDLNILKIFFWLTLFNSKSLNNFTGRKGIFL